MPDPTQKLIREREACDRQFENRVAILKWIGAIARAWRSAEINAELTALLDQGPTAVQLANNVVENKLDELRVAVAEYNDS